jgi:type II secretory pathway component PulC
MNSSKSKVSLVIGLAIVLLICIYFRFIHAKVKDSTENQTPSPPPTLSLEVPQVEKDQPAPTELSEKVPEALQEFVRNMFSPQSLTGRKPQAKAVKKTEEERPSFELKGTIVGKQRPIAIIDDQFVRTGDWIDDYQVAHIGKKEVILASGNKKIRLEMIKND